MALVFAARSSCEMEEVEMNGREWDEEESADHSLLSALRMNTTL